jgi:death-on-curing protein
MTLEIEWVELDVVLAFHRRQIAEYGGSEGVRDQGLLESALARPQNLHAYGTDIDIAALAAAYAFGIAKNHAFIDGNKRTALVVATAFLELNGYRLVAERTEIFNTVLRLANGEIKEAELAHWLRTNIVEG